MQLRQGTLHGNMRTAIQPHEDAGRFLCGLERIDGAERAALKRAEPVHPVERGDIFIAGFPKNHYLFQWNGVEGKDPE